METRTRIPLRSAKPCKAGLTARPPSTTTPCASAKPLAPQPATSSPRPPPPPPSSPPAPPSSRHGISIPRGAFSDPLVSHSLTAPSSPPPPLAAKTSVKIRDLLRSPKRDIEAPTPHAAANDVATSLLMPATMTPTASASVPMNPVDVLAKKLRQQAAELSHVYEEMELKDETLNQLTIEMSDLQSQLQIQRKKHHQLLQLQSRGYANTRPTGEVRRTNGGASKSMSKPASTSARSDNVDSNNIKRCDSKDDESDEKRQQQRQQQELQDALQHLNEALHEMKTYHDETLARLQTSPTLSDSEGSSKNHELTSVVEMLQGEQLRYVRVLEQAVHLRAQELKVTGHEELLVVLAELRHTIYQQEQALADTHQQCESLQAQCHTSEADLKTERARAEQQVGEARERECKLQRQLEDLQRLVHQEQMRYRREQGQQEEQRAVMARLREEARLQASRTSEAMTQIKALTGQCHALTQELEKVRAQLTSEQRAQSEATLKLERATRQVEELGALQDGFLATIEQMRANEAALDARVLALDASAQASHELEKKVHELQEQLEALDGEHTKLKVERENLRAAANEWGVVAPLVEAVMQTVTMGRDCRDGDADREVDVEAKVKARLDGLLASCAAVEVATRNAQMTAVAGSRLTNFPSAVHDACSTLRDVAEVWQSWTSERALLRAGCTEWQTTAELLEHELTQRWSQLSEARQRVAQCELEMEATRLQLVAMKEHVSCAHANRVLQDALSDQVLALERTLQSRQQQLHDVLLQNKELLTLETQLALKVETRDQELARMTQQLEHAQLARGAWLELEQELASAAQLSEEQNLWNQQLLAEFETAEAAWAEQDELVSALQNQLQAVSSRVTTLFSRFMQSLDALLAHEPPMDSRSRRAAVYAEVLVAGELVQMLQVLPGLVEEYVAVAISVDGHHLLHTTMPTELIKVMAPDNSSSRGHHQRSQVRPRSDWNGVIAATSQPGTKVDKTASTTAADSTALGQRHAPVLGGVKPDPAMAQAQAPPGSIAQLQCIRDAFRQLQT